MTTTFDAKDLKKSFTKRISQSSKYRKSALLKLYERQTPEEQLARMSKHLNRIGFTSVDAPFLTPLAEKVRSGAVLSTGQKRELKRRLPRYWRQFLATTLLEPANLPVPVVPKKGPGRAGLNRNQNREKEAA